jgi:hypothetical protein
LIRAKVIDGAIKLIFEHLKVERLVRVMDFRFGRKSGLWLGVYLLQRIIRVFFIM